MAYQPLKTDAAGNALISDADVQVTAVISAQGQSATLALSGDGGYAAEVQGTFVGTLQLERTVDGTTWRPVNGALTGVGTLVQTLTAPGSVQGYSGPSTGLRVVATGWTSGSATVTLRAGPGNGGLFLVAPLPAGSNVIGTVNTSTRVRRAAAFVHSGRLTVGAAADVSATAGRLWLLNPVGSGVTLAVTRAEFTSAPTAATAFPSAPRVTLERVTFTGTATGASLVPAVRDTADVALVGTVRTASTGLTLTAGATLLGFLVAPVLTAVGAAVPVPQTWDPDEPEQIILRPGQGLVVRQPDAGTTADTRVFEVDLSWEEF